MPRSIPHRFAPSLSNAPYAIMDGRQTSLVLPTVGCCGKSGVVDLCAASAVRGAASGHEGQARADGQIWRFSLPADNDMTYPRLVGRPPAV
jgi:hypothetical protein